MDLRKRSQKDLRTRAKTWLRKERELQDWSRERRSGRDWVQGRGWQRGREEGLLVSAVRGGGGKDDRQVQTRGKL